MKYGHKQLQNYFQKMGANLGYTTKKVFNKHIHTDGVWMIPHPLNKTMQIPLVAIEVIVSENPKIIRGSIRILEEVSPVLAIVVVHESEMINYFFNKGLSLVAAKHRVEILKEFIFEEIKKSSQRFELWNENTMKYWYELS